MTRRTRPHQTDDRTEHGADDDQPIPRCPIGSAASALAAAAAHLAARGGPDEIQAARDLLMHADELRRLALFAPALPLREWAAPRA